MSQQVTLEQALVGRGYRLTAPRRSIIAALVASNGHITADELAQEVRRDAPQVGRMTVYRTLDLLSELGTIRPIYQGTGAAHYILLPGGGHHHLVCNRCHTTIEFDDCLLGELAGQVAARFNFSVSSHLLELHGLCQACRP